MQFFGPHVFIMYLHDIVYTCKGKHSRQSANFKEKELEQDSNPRSPAYQAGALTTEPRTCILPVMQVHTSILCSLISRLCILLTVCIVRTINIP